MPTQVVVVGESVLLKNDLGRQSLYSEDAGYILHA